MIRRVLNTRTGHFIARVLASAYDDAHETLAGSGNRAFLQQHAESALRLYEITEPVVEAQLDEPFDALDMAVTVIRELADGHAVLSCDWTETERRTLPLPRLSDVNDVLVSYALVEWARKHGANLRLREGKRCSGGDEQHPEAAEPLTTLADAFRITIESYMAIEATSHEAERREWLGTRYAASAAWELANARNWVGWAHRNFGTASPAEGAAMVMLYIRQGLFVASHREELRGAFFPPRRLVRHWFRGAGVAEWLEGDGVVMPEWLDLEAGY